MEELIDQVLEHLFASYQAMGAERVDTNNFIISRGGDPNEVRIAMDRRGLIRFHQSRGFVAAISPHGIDVVAPDYFQEQADIVLQHAANNGGATTVYTALGNYHSNKAHDIANYIKRRGLAATQIAMQDARVYLP